MYYLGQSITVIATDGKKIPAIFCGTAPLQTSKVFYNWACYEQDGTVDEFTVELEDIKPIRIPDDKSFTGHKLYYGEHCTFQIEGATPQGFVEKNMSAIKKEFSKIKKLLNEQK